MNILSVCYPYVLHCRGSCRCEENETTIAIEYLNLLQQRCIYNAFDCFSSTVQYSSSKYLLPVAASVVQSLLINPLKGSSAVIQLQLVVIIILSSASTRSGFVVFQCVIQGALLVQLCSAVLEQVLNHGVRVSAAFVGHGVGFVVRGHEEECRVTLYVEALGHGVRSRVHRRQHHAFVVFESSCSTFKFRRQLLAVSAPRSIKFHQHVGIFVRFNDFFEVLGGEGDHLRGSVVLACR
mmetsp:Transcript_3437/g.5356  ORF Transcript_3437/g.5356 Transcript_3437/m.5356 type:complete len:237 (-) Transcript_3437:1164-1874(-)